MSPRVSQGLSQGSRRVLAEMEADKPAVTDLLEAAFEKAKRGRGSLAVAARGVEAMPESPHRTFLVGCIVGIQRYVDDIRAGRP